MRMHPTMIQNLQRKQDAPKPIIKNSFGRCKVNRPYPESITFHTGSVFNYVNQNETISTGLVRGNSSFSLRAEKL